MHNCPQHERTEINMLLCTLREYACQIHMHAILCGMLCFHLCFHFTCAPYDVHTCLYATWGSLMHEIFAHVFVVYSSHASVPHVSPSQMCAQVSHSEHACNLIAYGCFASTRLPFGHRRLEDPAISCGQSQCQKAYANLGNEPIRMTFDASMGTE